MVGVCPPLSRGGLGDRRTEDGGRKMYSGFVVVKRPLFLSLDSKLVNSWWSCIRGLP